MGQLQRVTVGDDSPVFNVTEQVPLSSGQYYTATTARSAVPLLMRKTGLIITYAKAAFVTCNMKLGGGMTLTNNGANLVIQNNVGII